jgi:hypothetical protein
LEIVEIQDPYTYIYIYVREIKGQFIVNSLYKTSCISLTSKDLFYLGPDTRFLPALPAFGNPLFSYITIKKS